MSILRALRQKAERASTGLPELMAEAERAVLHVQAGTHNQKRAGSGEKFWQFREYDISDRPQDVDWRQSAKSDRIYVRQKEWQTTQSVYIWAQNNALMDFTSQKMLPTKGIAAKILALAFAILMSRAGELIAPITRRVPAGRSELALEKLGHALIEDTTPHLPDARQATLKNRSTLILLGDFLAPLDDIQTMIDNFSAPVSQAILVQILDPAELNLPYDGRVLFESPAGSTVSQIIENVSDIREAYQARITDHNQNLQKICKKAGWHYLLHDTSFDIRRTLHEAHYILSPEYFAQSGGAR